MLVSLEQLLIKLGVFYIAHNRIATVLLQPILPHHFVPNKKLRIHQSTCPLYTLYTCRKIFVFYPHRVSRIVQPAKRHCGCSSSVKLKKLSGKFNKLTIAYAKSMIHFFTRIKVGNLNVSLLKYMLIHARKLKVPLKTWPNKCKWKQWSE